MIRSLLLLSAAIIAFGFRTGDPPSDQKLTAQKIKRLSEKYVESQNGKIKGYRVQIHFGAEKAKAMQIKSKFLSKYPDVRAYDPFDAPYFKIRVGDFRTKLEAYKFLKELHTDFAGAFIVTDEIELPSM